MVETSRSSTDHSSQAGAIQLSKHRRTIRSHGLRTPRRIFGDHTGQYQRGREAEKVFSNGTLPGLTLRMPRSSGRSSLDTSRPAQGPLLRQRETCPRLHTALQEPRHLARPGGGLAPREPRGGGGGKEVEKEGVAEGAAGGRQRRRRDAGWVGCGVPPAGGRRTSRTALPPAPLRPAAREPRPFRGLFPGSPRAPRPARRGAARRRAALSRPLPLPPLALSPRLPLAPFMKRGPITC